MDIITASDMWIIILKYINGRHNKSILKVIKLKTLKNVMVKEISTKCLNIMIKNQIF